MSSNSKNNRLQKYSFCKNSLQTLLKKIQEVIIDLLNFLSFETLKDFWQFLRNDDPFKIPLAPNSPLNLYIWNHNT